MKRASDPGPCSFPSQPSFASPWKKCSDDIVSFKLRSTMMRRPLPPVARSMAGKVLAIQVRREQARAGLSAQVVLERPRAEELLGPAACEAGSLDRRAPLALRIASG